LKIFFLKASWKLYVVYPFEGIFFKGKGPLAMISVVKKQGPKSDIIYLCLMKVGSDVQSVDICR
jgi:hypothetical protein